MKIITFYKCPICHVNHSSPEEAKRCMNKHQIEGETIIYCETCGAGWYVKAWGETRARGLAAACEKKHEEDGNAVEVARKAYFLSGGDHGWYYPPKT